MRAAALMSPIAVAVAMAAWRLAPEQPPDARPRRAVLAEAADPDLAFDGRLTGGFPPATRSTTRRGSTLAAATQRLSPDARIAIGEIEKRAEADPTQSALADVGVAYPVAGELDRPITTLTDATTLGPAAAPWSDLSAAYLTKAERVPARHIEYLSRALEAATRSLRIAPGDEARFNQSWRSTAWRRSSASPRRGATTCMASATRAGSRWPRVTSSTTCRSSMCGRNGTRGCMSSTRGWPRAIPGSSTTPRRHRPQR